MAVSRQALCCSVHKINVSSSRSSAVLANNVSASLLICKGTRCQPHSGQTLWVLLREIEACSCLTSMPISMSMISAIS